ncbi:AAA family ATPase [Colwellia sp. 4_MG-2023]|uniref:AAA family ATPase n=1 Tax=unclassified Colwellia TaxID=196834 RepID=UPI0026E2BB4B|nr:MULTISPECIES: AAA family ATPase [unclassified Colwellia]MDO6508684.1 AAA family ATPase [Colwellia sp. 5_MG-2023]MDO6557344.1 AAA family ATPase [Colwellia sp. 4_MG-2023]
MAAIIERFAIKSLYGERDVTIDFNSNVKILVAENGYGKTTVLNALFAIVSGNISKLREIDYESIEIDFSNGKKFKIDSSELKFSSEYFERGGRDRGIFDYLSRKCGEDKTVRLVEEYFSMSHKSFQKSALYKYFVRKADLPHGHLLSVLRDLTKKSKDDVQDLVSGREKLSEIRENFDLNIVYLPTYRRVEQDFEEFNSLDEEDFSDDFSINFGMKDVSRRFHEITEEIKSSSVQWFSKVNGEMLSQLVEGFKIDEDSKQSIDADALKIVLDRIGNNIEQSYKDKIIELVDSKEIFNGHDPLVYFISNLVKVYVQQKSNDKAIQDFSEVCNRYLVDKKVDYNESDVTIEIVRRKNGKPVDLENLSSGEKQIISLFARLYLKREDNLALFFDEPELSLSIEWQKTLLPDILNSGKCAYLFTTTHSPFIFENELAEHTVDLGHYIKEL